MEFRSAELQFNRGDILTREVLQELADAPKEIFSLFCGMQSDGILVGLDFRQEDEDIWLTAGILQLNNRFYVLPKDKNLSKYIREHAQGEDKQFYYLCLREEERHCGDSMVEHILKLDLDDGVTGLCLGICSGLQPGRIKLPKIDLRNRENPFCEFMRRGAYFDLRCIHYAYHGGATFHPYFFRAVRQYLAEKEYKNSWDIAVYVELLNHPVLSRELMCAYISEAHISPDTSNREHLFENFVKALVMVKKPPTLFYDDEYVDEEPDDNDDRGGML